MGDLFKEGSIFSALDTSTGSASIAITMIIITAVYMIARTMNLSIVSMIIKLFKWCMKLSGKMVRNKERKYRRDLAIGKIDEKRRRVKTYRFFNDLSIDLGIKKVGGTPYELMFLCMVGSAIATVLTCKIAFNNMFMIGPLYPIMLTAIVCGLYTKANLAHDRRIEAIIEAENIICSNIKDGVVVAVTNSINVMPSEVRESLINFLDNVRHKGYHIRTALLELNAQLGSVADDFIKKCIGFELEEEHGIVGMFRDVVEMNNVKMEARIEMKRRFEEVKNQFITGVSMILLFLGGVLIVYKDVAWFYFNTPIGQIILALDFLVLISEFVYITYLRAKEI